jgi:hypothetical protein
MQHVLCIDAYRIFQSTVGLAIIVTRFFGVSSIVKTFYIKLGRGVGNDP